MRLFWRRWAERRRREQEANAERVSEDRELRRRIDARLRWLETQVELERVRVRREGS